VGQCIIASAKQALAFAQVESNNCVVFIIEEVDVERIREEINMSQSQFAAYFGVSEQTIGE
jgi:DNA-binding transcriptional regulator YiaG